MKKENEVAAAVLAVGATDDDEVFGFYKDSLSTKGWKVGPKMKNPVMKMSVMEFTKGNSRLNVGTMDYNIGKKKGIMINLSLEQ